MKKTLTEKWRNGKLTSGFYYIQLKDERWPLIDHTYYNLSSKKIEWKDFDWRAVEEVIDEVPSYEEYKRLVSNSDESSRKALQLEEELKNETISNDLLCEQIKKQDSQLKDMACENDTLCMENGRLQERLAIATKALKGVSLWANTGNGGEKAVKKVCDKALKEMEGVK